MRPKYLRRQGRMLAVIAYCGTYTERGLSDRAALLEHIPGVRKSDFMRRCAIYHISISLRATT